jgi:hypothetical protein
MHPGTVGYITTYTVLDTIPATAGLGAFNASMADYWIPSYLAFMFSLASFDLFEDPAKAFVLSTPICYGAPACKTFYLNGGLAFTYPDPYTEPDLVPEADVLVARQTLGILVSYWDLSSAEVDAVDESQIDCLKIGAGNMAFQLCLAPSTTYTNHIVAGSSLNLSS